MEKATIIPATGAGCARKELALVILFIWSTLGIKRPCDGIGVGASHIDQKKKKKQGADIQYTFHTGGRQGS